MKKNWGYLLAILLFAGCIGDEFDTDKLSDEINISPGINLPIGYADLSMRDILSESTDQVKYYKDEEGNERIVFYQNNDSLSYLGINDFFNISAGDVQVPVPLAGFNAIDEFSASENLAFSIPNASVSQMEIAYQIDISGSNFVVPVILNLNFPTINQDQGGRSISTQLEGNQTVSFSFERDKVQLIDEAIPVEISVSPVSAMETYPNEIGQVTLSINNLSILSVKGTMSENAISIDEDVYQMDLDVLDEFPVGITFADPRLHLISNNSTPFKGLIATEFKGQTEADEVINLATPLIQMSANNQGAESVIDTTTLDKSNSNIQTFMDELPKQLIYSGDLLLNPDGELSEEVELDENDRIYVGYSVELPMELVIDTALIEVDTLDVSDNDVLDKLVEGSLVVKCNNGLPFEALVWISFYDQDADNGNGAITEVIEANLIKGAEVDEKGIPVQRVESLERIDLTDERIIKLQEAEEIYIRLGIVSSEIESKKPVVLLTTNEISMQVTLKGQLSY